MRMRGTLLIVLLLASIFVSAEDAKPAKPKAEVDGVAAVGNAIPKEYQQREPWTDVQAHLVSEWAEKTFVGKSFECTDVLLAVNFDEETRTVSVATRERQTALTKGSCLSGVSARFSPFQLQAMAKVKKGDKLTFFGTIKQVTITNTDSGLFINVRIDNAMVGPYRETLR